MNTRTLTHLTLDEWCQNVGMDRFFAAQFSRGFPTQVTRGCDTPWFQYNNPSNGDRLTREEVAQSIHDAEHLFSQLTRFPPAPTWVEGESIPYPHPSRLDMRGTMVKWDGMFKSVQTKWRLLRQIGVKLETQLTTDTPITRADRDGDGVKEVWTATVTVPDGTTADEIRVFHTESERLTYPKDTYEIRPVTISVSGTTATLTGGAWLVAKPVKYEGYSPQELDVTDDANFVTEVEVWRVRADTTSQGTLVWETTPGESNAFDVEAQTAIFTGRNLAQGIIVPKPATYNATTGEWELACVERGYAPDRVVVSYLAGYPTSTGYGGGRLHPTIARIITKLSVSLLTRQGCGCDRANSLLERWSSYPTRDMSSGHVSFLLTRKHLEAPWGAKIGAIEAYQEALEFMEVNAV